MGMSTTSTGVTEMLEEIKNPLRKTCPILTAGSLANPKLEEAMDIVESCLEEGCAFWVERYTNQGLLHWKGCGLVAPKGD